MDVFIEWSDYLQTFLVQLGFCLFFAFVKRKEKKKTFFKLIKNYRVEYKSKR